MMTNCDVDNTAHRGPGSHQDISVGVEPKNRGKTKPPKMDGEFIMENPMKKWDDLGGFSPYTTIFGSTSKWSDMGSPYNKYRDISPQ